MCLLIVYVMISHVSQFVRQITGQTALVITSMIWQLILLIALLATQVVRMEKILFVVSLMNRRRQKLMSENKYIYEF